MSTEIIFLSRNISFQNWNFPPKEFPPGVEHTFFLSTELFLPKQNEFFPEWYISCQKFFWNLSRIVSFQQKSILSKIFFSLLIFILSPLILCQQNLFLPRKENILSKITNFFGTENISVTVNYLFPKQNQFFREEYISFFKNHVWNKINSFWKNLFGEY